MFFHATQHLGHVFVVLHRIANLLGRMGLAEAIGNVCRMAKSAGEVAFKNVGFEVGMLSAADSIDEVGKMTGTAAELLELFIFFIKSDSAVVTRNDQRAAFTVSHDANARAVIF